MCNPSGPILLVEDQKADAILFRRALEKITKEPPVVEITNGDDAIEYLAGTGKYADRMRYPLPNLIVLDIKMPRRNGFEVLDWLRAQTEAMRFTPVLMLSSSSRREDVETSYERGANSYLTKPYTAEEYSRMASAVASFWLKYNEQGHCPRMA